MNIGESIRLAWEGLKANKMRSLLTMLGIIIGISSVIAILTVGNALNTSVLDSMSSLGASNIEVFLQPRTNDTRIEVTEDDLISDEMIEAMRERFGSQIVGVSMTESVGSGKAEDGRKYANVSLTGVTEDYMKVSNLTLLHGRAINQKDLDGSRSVAIVSDRLVNSLFGGSTGDALGGEVKVRVGTDIYVFRVIGVYKHEQNSFMGMSFSSDEDIRTGMYIPLTSAKRLTNSENGYSNITVMANSQIDSAAFATTLEEFFDKYYANNLNLRVGAVSMEAITSQMSSVMGTLSIALSLIAGISLVVGGIGVMNIMLVSVTERTREIGTRKALGATNGNIRVQFVVESIIVCLVGGMIGVVLGGVLGYIGSSFLNAQSGPTLGSIFLAVGFSMGIGIFFGYYPANKAAKLDPIEALRYE